MPLAMLILVNTHWEFMSSEIEIRASHTTVILGSILDTEQEKMNEKKTQRQIKQTHPLSGYTDHRMKPFAL